MKNEKFADGGIVYGPTNALIGEYSNANTEDVAPLNKLKQMIKDVMKDKDKDAN